MTSYFCEIWSIFCMLTRIVLRNFIIMSNSSTTIKTHWHGIQGSAVFRGQRSQTTYFVSFQQLFMTSARGKSNHTLIEFMYVRPHYSRQFSLNMTCISVWWCVLQSIKYFTAVVEKHACILNYSYKYSLTTMWQ